MLRYLFLPLVTAGLCVRLLGIFIIVFVLNGCVPAAIGEMVKPKTKDSPLLICTDGVRAYLDVTAKVEVTGTDKRHLEVVCK